MAGPDKMLNAGLGLGLIGDAAQLGLGIYDRIKAKKMAEEAGDITYDIQKEYYGNNNLAADRAQSGFSDAAKNYYTTQADRGLSAGVDAMLQGGGGINAIQGLYDQYAQANNRFAAQDDQLQEQKINRYMTTNKDLAGQKTMKWAIEKYEPWKNKQLAATQGQQSGTQNILGALGNSSSRLSAFSMANDYDELMRSNPTQNVPTQGAPITPVQMIGATGITPSVNTKLGQPGFSSLGPTIDLQGELTPAQIKAYQDAMINYGDSPYMKGFVLPQTTA